MIAVNKTATPRHASKGLQPAGKLLFALEKKHKIGLLAPKSQKTVKGV